MRKKAIAFYWTLPVPWAGIRTVDQFDIAKTVTQSRTISLQRGVIRRWAAENGFELIHEEGFMEIAPDRGSDHIVPVLDDLVEKSRPTSAKILYVDFGRAIGWRSHQYLDQFVSGQSDAFISIFPQSPFEEQFENHFTDWRARQKEWTAAKEARAQVATDEMIARRSKGQSFAQIANDFNLEEIRSPSGKPWTADNLRKLVQPITENPEH